LTVHPDIEIQDLLLTIPIRGTIAKWMTGAQGKDIEETTGVGRGITGITTETATGATAEGMTALQGDIKSRMQT